jgi:DNA-binding transcriptional ArsR family regulator
MVKHHDQALDNVFQALSDQTRRAILRRLAKKESSVTELAEPFQMSLAAVSKHIKVLEKAGLVLKSKEGRVFRCQANLDPLGDANRILEELAGFWQSRLDALDALFIKSSSPKGAAHGPRTNATSTETRNKKNHPRKKRTGI